MAWVQSIANVLCKATLIKGGSQNNTRSSSTIAKVTKFTIFLKNILVYYIFHIPLEMLKKSELSWFVLLNYDISQKRHRPGSSNLGFKYIMQNLSLQQQILGNFYYKPTTSCLKSLCLKNKIYHISERSQ